MLFVCTLRLDEEYDETVFACETSANKLFMSVRFAFIGNPLSIILESKSDLLKLLEIIIICA